MGVTPKIGPDIGQAEALDVLEKRSSNEAGTYLRHFFKRWRILLLLLLIVAVFCETVWLVALTAKEADLVHYQCYGLAFWLGSHGAGASLPPAECAFLISSTPQPAFHMLPVEYPPLTVLLFSLPLLAPLPAYALVFALLMTLVAGLIYWLLEHSDARKAAPIFLLYLLLGAAGVFQERFDLLPAACTLICVLAAERERWRAAYAALALGTLLKFYPIVMLPALFLAEQRAWWIKQGGTSDQREFRPAGVRGWRWSNALLFVGLLVVVMGSFARLNTQEAIISPLQYLLARPTQIESLAGSVLWAGGHFGASPSIFFNFGSLNIDSELARLISPVDMLLSVTGVLCVFWLQWRRHIDFAQAAVGLLCILMTTGKVFSPQYLIWLIPLLAYVYAHGKVSRAWMIHWAVICALTTFIYIFYYSRLTDPLTDAQVVRTLGGFFELVALRNLLLLGATVAFLCGWWQTRAVEPGFLRDKKKARA